MVWGGMSKNGMTDLTRIHDNLNDARYCAELFVPINVPFMTTGNVDIL